MVSVVHYSENLWNIYVTTFSQVNLENLIVIPLTRNSLNFMEPDGLQQLTK